MAKPFITALIDTYNHEAFIEEAINSVLQQTFPSDDVEILVVDDGSIDRTPEIVQKFVPRVRLLRKTNGGQASAFNAGILKARGEIVAFLDGDDWWAPGKLTAVAEAFAANAAVGLVGHGITEVYPDGRQRTEVPREVSRFRIASVQEAKTFRMQRGFLGTSRMAYRRNILSRIGQVPDSLVFEADEYLFTFAGLFADVIILRQALTYYRLHSNNLFQLSSANAQAVRKKQHVLEALVWSLRKQLQQNGVPVEIAGAILECVDVEAEVLRLQVENGFPWETIATELKVLRVFHRHVSLWQHLFSCIRLIPACVLPSATYYNWRRWFTLLPFYQEFRSRLLPFPVPSEVERRDEPARSPLARATQASGRKE